MDPAFSPWLVSFLAGIVIMLGNRAANRQYHTPKERKPDLIDTKT